MLYNKYIECKATGSIDILNTISLQTNCDIEHHIYYFKHGVIHSMSLQELDTHASKVAHQLHALGVVPGDRIGVMSKNQIEWVILDIAIIKLGAVTAGFEPGRYNQTEIINIYSLKYLFIDTYNDNNEEKTCQIMSITNIAEWISTNSVCAVSSYHNGYDPASICAIKFTSGSTGNPKGLEVTTSSVNSSINTIQNMFNHNSQDNILIFLRLSLIQQRFWIYSAMVYGYNISIASVDTVLRMAQGVGPSIIMGVPDFYNQIKRTVEEDCINKNNEDIKNNLRAILGNKIRYLWTGSAPIRQDVLKFFYEHDIPLYEGYGLNETCIVAKNYPKSYRIGSVGKVLPNKKIRFDKDGVLIVKSEHPINYCYTWASPEANKKMFLPSGEVKTYDIGYLDEDGFLYITGRVDDIITMSTGRNVLIRTIEDKICEFPNVYYCTLYGHGKPFITAIISVNIKISIQNLSEYITELNLTLFKEQNVHAVIITQQLFTIENNLLTSQFKLKRKNIYSQYYNELDKVYTILESSSNNNMYSPVIQFANDSFRSNNNVTFNIK